MEALRIAFCEEKKIGPDERTVYGYGAELKIVKKDPLLPKQHGKESSKSKDIIRIKRAVANRQVTLAYPASARKGASPVAALIRVPYYRGI